MSALEQRSLGHVGQRLGDKVVQGDIIKNSLRGPVDDRVDNGPNNRRSVRSIFEEFAQRKAVNGSTDEGLNDHVTIDKCEDDETEGPVIQYERWVFVGVNRELFHEGTRRIMYGDADPGPDWGLVGRHI